MLSSAAALDFSGLLPAQLQMHGYRRIVKCLIICITQHKGHIMNALIVHVVNGIASTTSHADNLDDASLFFRLTKIKHTFSLRCAIVL